MHPLEELLGPAAATTWLRDAAPFALVTVEGADAVDFVQRLCTQDVGRMAPGECRPAAFLSSKGRLLATAWVGRGADAVHLTVPAAQAAALHELLDRYHFTEKITLRVRDDLAAADVFGPEAERVTGMPHGACRELAPGGVLLAWTRHGVPWVRAHLPAAALGEQPWRQAGLPAPSADVAEALRIVSGQVDLQRDVDERTLALEAGIDDHVAREKGCYVGQEIVARVDTYGHVNRELRLLRIDGDGELPASPVRLVDDEGEAAGRVTSSVVAPGGGFRLALGYVASERAAPGTQLGVGKEGGRRAIVVAFG